MLYQFTGALVNDPQTAPLYRQISDMIVRRIASGVLIEGERLAPEREMAAELGIAVGTLRRALSDLAGQGLIERRQGSGNYVRRVRDLGGLYGFFRLELLDGGGLPDAELVAVERRPKPAGAPDFGASDAAWRIRRIRTLDGMPVAAEEIWLDAGRAARLEAAEIAPSLYRTYRKRLGLRIQRVEDRCGVAPAPGWCAAALGLEAGRSAGHVERLSWAHDGRRAEFSETWFDAGRCRYVSRLR